MTAAMERPEGIDFAGVRLVSERLVLRPPVPDDVDATVVQIGDPAVSRMLARVPHPYRRADAEAWVERTREAHRARIGLHLVIDTGNGVIGGIGLHGFPEPEFGYWLGRDHWGLGYATEAGRALLAFAFGPLGLSRIRSGVFRDNPASLMVQAKLGFAKTGESRRMSLARGCEVAHIDTVLDRERYIRRFGTPSALLEAYGMTAGAEGMQ